MKRGSKAKTPHEAPSWRTRLKRWGIAVGGATALLAFAAVAFRAAVGWVFPVASGSMEPVIETGDWVFIRYGNENIERFDLVAYTDVAGGTSLKRAVGIGPENFAIDEAGDIRINGRLLPDAPGRPDPIPMFDSSLQSIGAHFRHGGTALDPWERLNEAGPEEVWRVDGRLVDRGAATGLLRFMDRVDDGWLSPDGTRVSGKNVVQDVIVEFEARVVEPGGILLVELVEQGDTFVAFMRFDGVARPHHAGILRYTDRRPEHFVFEPMAPPESDWFSVRFSNVDNRLKFTVGGDELEANYDAAGNTPRPGRPQNALSIGERVRFGAQGLILEVRNVRVWRDFHVIAKGEFGAGRTLALGTGEIFVLGDSSAISRDSRERGPIPVSRVVGHARAVVWPFENAKEL